MHAACVCVCNCVRMCAYAFSHLHPPAPTLMHAHMIAKDNNGWLREGLCERGVLRVEPHLRAHARAHSCTHLCARAYEHQRRCKKISIAFGSVVVGVCVCMYICVCNVVRMCAHAFSHRYTDSSDDLKTFVNFLSLSWSFFTQN